MLTRRCQVPRCDRNATRFFEANPRFLGSWVPRAYVCDFCQPNQNVYDGYPVLLVTAEAEAKQPTA